MTLRDLIDSLPGLGFWLMVLFLAGDLLGAWTWSAALAWVGL
jgi:hypothetical protein